MSKVARVINEYDLDDIGEELEREWIGAEGQRMSLRELANYLNKRLLERAIEQEDEEVMDSELGNLYQLLTDDDVPASTRARAETKIARFGVDVDSIRHDFISHQAMHTYLTGVRGVSPPSTETTSGAIIENRRGTIQRLRSRTKAVTEQSLDKLRDADHLTLGTFDVMVGITVYCQKCDRTNDILDVLDQQGCACRKASD